MTQEVKSALVHFMGGNAPECKWAQGLLWNLNNWFNLFVSFTASQPVVWASDALQAIPHIPFNMSCN